MKMKKHLKSFGVIAFMLLLCVLLSFINRKKTEQQQEKTQQEDMQNLFIPNPTPDKNVQIQGYTSSEQQFVYPSQMYEKGKTGTQEGVEYTIKEVTLQDSIEDSDGYYAEREKLKAAIDSNTSMTRYVVYEDELRYLTIVMNVHNTCSEQKTITTDYFSSGNIREDCAASFGGHPADWRIWDIKGDEQVCNNKLTMDANAAYTIECIFVIQPAKVYDYYLAVSAEAWSVQTCIYLNLDLTLHETDGFTFIVDENAKSTEELRDLAQLKIDHITNKELAESQQEGSLILEKYFHNASDTFGRIISMDGENDSQIEIYDSKICTLDNVILVNSYEELPESFQSRNYLRDMADAYIKKFGYEESELQYLLITITIEQKENIEKYLQITDVSQLMWLYNRDENNCLWKIGYPDDYEVKGDDGKAAEHIDSYIDSENAVHTITAAYVIWPGALQDVYLWQPGNGDLVEGTDNTFSKEGLNDTAGGVKIEVY
jgi:hypothetical protein